MKKLIFTLFNLLIILSVFAQTPLQFKYQAVLRDANGNVIEGNHTIVIDILKGSVTGTSMFQETHEVLTTAQGIINLNIGSLVDLGSIDWSNDIYFIQIDVDGTIMGTSQLLAVPYALNAKSAETADYNNLTNTPDLSNYDTDVTDDFSGNYNDLTNQPAIPEDISELTDNSSLLFDGDYNNLTNTPDLSNYDTDVNDDFSGNYNDLTNQPAIPEDISELTDNSSLLFDGDYNNLTNTPDFANWDTNVNNDFSGNYNDLTNQPAIPEDISELTDNSSLLFDGDYNNLTNIPDFTGWDNNVADDFSGNYNDLTNQPTIPRDINGLSDTLSLLFDGQYGSLTGAPTNVSAFANDAGYLTSFMETDPTIGTNYINYVTKYDGSQLVYSTIYQDDTKIIFYYPPLYQNKYVFNFKNLEFTNNSGNIPIGEFSGKNIDLKESNNNIMIGNFSGETMTTGDENVFIGYASGGIENGSNNTYLGSKTGFNISGGLNNVFIGAYSGYNKMAGDCNTFVGSNSGYLNSGGIRNIFIGYNSGYNETGSNLLYIENSDSSSPLIWGDFASDIVNINGCLGVGTNAPSTKLDVSGVITANGGNSDNWNTAYSWGNHSNEGYLTSFTEVDPKVGSNTVNYLSKWDGTSLVSSSIFDNGNVGIGTTNPSTKLDITGNTGVRVSAESDSRALFEMRGIYTTATNNDILGTFTFSGKNSNNDIIGYSRIYSFAVDVTSGSEDGEIAFYNTINGANTPVMTINGSNVGIGTSNPIAKLDTKGQVLIDPSSRKTSGTFNDALLVEGDASIVNSTGGDSYLHLGYKTTTPDYGYIQYDYKGSFLGDLKIATNNQGGNILLLPYSGNVGIGEPNPARPLVVASNGVNWISGVFGGSGGTDKVVIGNVYGKACIGGHNQDLNGWTDLVLQVDAGNVGIGTSTPMNKVDIEGAAVIGSSYSGTNTAPTNGLLVEGNVGIGTTSPVNKLDVSGGVVIGTGVAGSINAPTNGLLVQGSLGVGTSPSYTLDVAGTGRFTSSVYFPGNGIWRSDSRIGIGTTNPQQSLQVSGNAFITNALSIGIPNPGTRLTVVGLTGTASYNSLMYDPATGNIFYWTSSKKYKSDIQPLVDDFDKILLAEPKSFTDNESGLTEIGFIAEEFEALGLNNLVIYKDGEPDALKYSLISVYLLEVIKELKTQNDVLIQRIEALENK